MSGVKPAEDAGAATPAPSLRARLEQLAHTIERQQAAFTRLRELRPPASLSEQEHKNLREVTAHSMAVRTMLRGLEHLPAAGAEADAGSGEELDRQRQFAALARTAELVNSSLELGAVLAQVMDTFVALTGAERGFLMLRDDTGKLQVRTARNLDRETIAAGDFAISRTVAHGVARDGRVVVTTNAQVDHRFSAQHSIVTHALRSIACVPLRARGHVTGVLYADHRVKAGVFDGADDELLSAFADQASIAVENARLHASVTATRDLMRNVFESVTSGVLTLDGQDRLTLFNRAAERIVGARAEQCVGKPLDAALGELGTLLQPLVARVRGRGVSVVDHEMNCSLPGRGQLHLRVGAAPLAGGDGSDEGAVLVLDDITERRRAERERALVLRYLPSQLVESLADLDELQLGGARETVSIFFADIRGFTSYSEKHDAVQVMEAINSYFGLAQEAIHANRGIVDKYMGDAVMAHYNTPLRPEPEHAWLAVRTAWHTRLAIEAYRAEHADAAALEFGIGINTGEAVAGNVGASDYMEYTLIGDAVNLAKRLQENAGPRQILLGRRTYELVRERVKVVALEPLRVKGREASESVYELLGLRE